MIEITMNTGRMKLTIWGHAMPEETEEYRQVCAGVSAIAQGLAWCVSKFGDEQAAAKSIEYRPDPGDLLLRVYPEEWAERELRHRFRNYADALELMAKAHPESVSFIYDGEKILPEKEAKK